MSIFYISKRVNLFCSIVIFSFVILPLQAAVPTVDIAAKEFYFLRHAEVDGVKFSEIKYINGKADPAVVDMSLNAVGVQHAQDVAKLIREYPIQTICCSPLKRAQETKDIISQHLHVQTMTLSYLRALSSATRVSMSILHLNPFDQLPDFLQGFVIRVAHGLKIALEQPGPVLIIAHGRVLKTICFLLDIDPEYWVSINCQLIHFYQDESNQWHLQPEF